MKNRLKRRIWVTATAILLAFVIILTLNPTAYIAILPVIIPSGIITLGLPVYDIKMNKKENTKEIRQSNQKVQSENIPNKIIQDKTNIIFEPEYQNFQQDKPKVKTKGTIH